MPNIRSWRFRSDRLLVHDCSQQKVHAWRFIARGVSQLIIKDNGKSE
jgi:hypothetical protein